MLQVTALATGPAGIDPAGARGTVQGAIEIEAQHGCDLVVLPELFAHPYLASADPRFWPDPAEAALGPTCAWAALVAARSKVALLFGMALSDGPGRPANAAVLVLPSGERRVLATKANLPPAEAGFGEPDWFLPGTGPLAVVTLHDVRIAALVCYDRRYPEAWRAALDLGADLVAVLVAGPAPDDPPGIYDAELRAHARANAVFVVAAARYGTETLLPRPVRHDGETLAIDFDGQLLDQAHPPASSAARLTITPEGLGSARRLREVRTAGRNRYGSFQERTRPCRN